MNLATSYKTSRPLRSVYYRLILFKHSLKCCTYTFLAAFFAFYYSRSNSPKNQKFTVQASYFGESLADYLFVLCNLPSLLSANSCIDIYIYGPPANRYLYKWFFHCVDLISLSYPQTSSKSLSIHCIESAPSDTLYQQFYRSISTLGAWSYLPFQRSHSSRQANTSHDFPASQFLNYLVPSIKNIPARFIHNNDFQCAVLYDYDYSIRNASPTQNNRFIPLASLTEALDHLLSSDYIVYRLGRSNQPLPFRHPRLIDIAQSNLPHPILEVLDFYYASQAKLCLNTGAGGAAICETLNIPTLRIGFHKFSEMHKFDNTMYLPNILVEQDGSFVPWNILANVLNFPHTSLFEFIHNLSCLKPSSSDIYSSLLELEALIDSFSFKSHSLPHPQLSPSDLQLRWRMAYLQNNPICSVTSRCLAYSSNTLDNIFFPSKHHLISYNHWYSTINTKIFSPFHFL